MYVQVALARRLADYQDILTYQVPELLRVAVHWGSLVLAPLGTQQVEGYVVEIAEEKAISSVDCKEILSVLEAETLLNQELVELAVWISRYYLCPCYYVLAYMLPKFARNKRTELICWVSDSDLTQAQMLLLEESTAKLAMQVQKKGKVALTALQKQFPQAAQMAAQLEQIGLVKREFVFAQRGGSKEIVQYRSCVQQEQLPMLQQKLGRAVRQWEILRYLTYTGPCEGRILRGYWPHYQVPVRELQKKGLVQREVLQKQRFCVDSAVFRNASKLVLNEEQQAALTQILALLADKKMHCVLLHGVTGSGKTEVYLRTLRHALDAGWGAMVLVPEISLTPQLIGRFRAVLGEYVEVLHSNLSDGERFDAWQRLRSGQTRMVVGVRSAVFAPVQQLRLIIMDEEHETTFKQSEPDPRYHARTVARQRMKQNGGLLLLGSATPSVESYAAAQRGDTVLLTMRQRAKQQPLPAVRVVDMAEEFRQGNRSMFSKALQVAMEESLQRGEQVILFLNRRGFSSAIVCRECGYTLTCEKCSIALTYHKEQQLVRCHYCDYVASVPTHCPHCGSRFIRYMGSGTELVLEEVQSRWPWVKVDRMDLDTTQNKDAHNQILERFAKGETQVLVGTQMVAKGLDFPNVTTVGVLAADMILNLPDYTASERTFQLLTQVAGRAGRGDKPGQVVIQTYNPQHYSILAAQQHDYVAFYQKEIQARELMAYPPFSYLVRVLLSDFRADGLMALLQQMAQALSQRYPSIELLGPAEAPISMVRRRYRFHLLLKGNHLTLLREAAEYGQKVMNLSRKSKTLRILIDVEPLSVL